MRSLRNASATIVVATVLAVTNVPCVRAQAVAGDDSRAMRLAMRTVSGTSWAPEATTHGMLNASVSGWSLRVHGSAFAGYTREATPKGGARAGSQNWGMFALSRDFDGRLVTVSAMGSVEAWTLGECGYPRLLTSGPRCNVDGFREYQHAHPPVMELAGRFEMPLAGTLRLLLYAGLAGEPALGPPAWLHRSSAAADPIAPITFHETNPAHVADGVITAGVFSDAWKIEASAFNGEPVDAHRIVPILAPLHSFAARASFNPDPHWSIQASAGRIHSSVSHHEGAGSTLKSMTASASHEHPFAGGSSTWATTLGWAWLDDEVLPRNAIFAETAITIARHTFFARAEAAERADADVTIIEHEDGTHDHIIDARRLGVGEISAGYLVTQRIGRGLAGLGIRASLGFVPDFQVPVYRTARPLGFTVYANLRPALHSSTSAAVTHRH
jgi:hypothetical protein